MKLSYSLDKIKFATDRPTFEKAAALYENGRVTQFTEELNGFFTTVLRTSPLNFYAINQLVSAGKSCWRGCVMKNDARGFKLPSCPQEIAI